MTSHLKAIKASDPEFSEAEKLSKRVKSEEDRLVKETAQKLKQAAIVAREKYADEFERNALRKGIDLHVTLSGQEKTTITFKYILLSRPDVFQLQESNFFENLKKQGFKRAVLTDGYNHAWQFDLTK